MSAIISECGTYRYRLERGDPTNTRVAAFIMVNPSTADAEHDDATIRKLRGFSQEHGYGRFIVGNLFAFRSKDVRDLRTIVDPVGPENNLHLRFIFEDADDVIVAWGPVAKQPKHLRRRYEFITWLAEDTGKQLRCLGTANDGHPRHPLMTPYSMPLTEWKEPRP